MALCRLWSRLPGAREQSRLMSDVCDIVASWWDANALVREWVDVLNHAAHQEREIRRLCRAEQFVTVYKVVESWSLKTVNVLSLPVGLGCRACKGREYWSYVGEPNLYRCARCFPRPTKATPRDLALHAEVKRIENLIRS